MPVIKAKNANGEWVNVAAANNTSITATGTLKTAVVQAATSNTFDLSSYVAPGARFILIFFVYDTVDNIVGTSQGIPFVWDSSIGEIQEKAPASVMGITTDVVWNDNGNERLDFTFNAETCVLTVADASGGDNINPHFTTGTLYYAG